MNAVLTEKLYASFPYLYRGRHKSMQETCMCWGFECDDGWYQLLFDLSQALTDYQTRHPEIEFEARQVKSKFGYLCFYLDYSDDSMREMIQKASERASNTCELTGKPGVLCSSSHRRVMVLCPEKAAELGFTPCRGE